MLKSCLLICPLKFYSFSGLIEKELEEIGYKVSSCNEEYPATFFGKIIGSLKLPLSRTLTKRVIERDYLKNKRYDLILIIKGRGVGEELIRSCKLAAGKVIGYHFDSFEYNPSAYHWYKEVEKCHTFDYRDATTYNLSLVELFSSLENIPEEKVLDYDFSAILRNHSDRLKYLNKVLSVLKIDRKFVYIYEKDVLTFIWNFLNNPILYFKYWKFIHFKALAYSDYQEVLSKSDFTLDYAHPKQSGITIRCFEAASCGTKLITNNFSVLKNEFFSKKNCIVYSDEMNGDILAESYYSLRHTDIIKNKRTLKEFINDLLNK